MKPTIQPAQWFIVEIERLRALIKDAEWENFKDDSSQLPYCPWCDARQNAAGKHEDDCPAFTPTGEVR